MAKDQEATLKALETALQMEIDGKEFYNRAAASSSSEIGKKLLSTLAAEEDIHRKAFASIYESMREKKGWPDVSYHTDGGANIRTVFNDAIKNKEKLGALTTEMEAVVTARQMEAKTFDFYTSQAETSTDPTQIEFFKQLAAQEQEHNLVLTDYYEYLQNPESWFVKMEHPTLD